MMCCSLWSTSPQLLPAVDLCALAEDVVRPGGGLVRDLLGDGGYQLLDALRLAPFQTLWLAPHGDDDVTPAHLATLMRNTFFSSDWLAAHQHRPTTVASWQRSAAAVLGLPPINRHRYRVVAESSGGGERTTRRVTFVRHGHSFHQLLGRLLCPADPHCHCFDAPLPPDEQVSARQRCASHQPAAFDAPLTARGRAEVAAIALDQPFDAVYAACDTRAL